MKHVNICQTGNRMIPFFFEEMADIFCEQITVYAMYTMILIGSGWPEVTMIWTKHCPLPLAKKQTVHSVVCPMASSQLWERPRLREPWANGLGQSRSLWLSSSNKTGSPTHGERPRPLRLRRLGNHEAARTVGATHDLGDDVHAQLRDIANQHGEHHSQVIQEWQRWKIEELAS